METSTCTNLHTYFFENSTARRQIERHNHFERESLQLTCISYKVRSPPDTIKNGFNEPKSKRRKVRSAINSHLTCTRLSLEEGRRRF